ncbi:flavin reductase family protein [Streptomyces sp. NPDC050560]|uniref:flavin reductase family protein n=1 Tax=Streptomyces sp. NPDC050560 TaxID=3365630 RepID=UPI0037B24F0C
MADSTFPSLPSSPSSPSPPSFPVAPAEPPPQVPVDDRPVEQARFRHAFRQVAGPVAVVLVHTPSGGVSGLTCTSAASLSGDPPMVMVAVDDRTGVAALVREARRFSVNYLAADRAYLARAFSTGGRDLTGLAGTVRAGRTRVPTLASGTTAVLECRIADIHRGGDHWILSATVLHARFQADAKPLLYAAGRYGTFEPAGNPP